MCYPEDGVPIRYTDWSESLDKIFLDVLGDQPGYILEEVEGESHFTKVANYRSLRVRQDGLLSRYQLEQWMLNGGVRICTDYKSSCTISKECLPK